MGCWLSARKEVDETQGPWEFCMDLPPGVALEGTGQSHPPSSRADPSRAHTGTGRPGAADLHSPAQGLHLGGRVHRSSASLCQALTLDGTSLWTRGPLRGHVHPRKNPSAPVGSLEFSKPLSGGSTRDGSQCVYPW